MHFENDITASIKAIWSYKDINGLMVILDGKVISVINCNHVRFIITNGYCEKNKIEC